MLLGILISILFSTAGSVLAAALSPAVHGSSHGLASFSGYPLPHVDPQNHSFSDIHTHHHITSSTIFTPAGSWESDLYLPSGSGLSAVTQDKTELEFLSVDEVMKVGPNNNFSLKGHSQLMHMRIKYQFLADLHVTRRA